MAGKRALHKAKSHRGFWPGKKTGQKWFAPACMPACPPMISGRSLCRASPCVVAPEAGKCQMPSPVKESICSVFLCVSRARIAAHAVGTGTSNTGGANMQPYACRFRAIVGAAPRPRGRKQYWAGLIFLMPYAVHIGQADVRIHRYRVLACLLRPVLYRREASARTQLLLLYRRTGISFFQLSNDS